MELSLLEQLCNLHSTSAMEEEVFSLMEQSFEKNNWEIYRNNNYYLIANKTFSIDYPTILITAHADSPGWEIANMKSTTVNEESLSYKLSSVGDISHSVNADAITKVGQEKIEGKISNGYFVVKKSEVKDIEITNGDRVCFMPQLQLSGTILEATFLDNRIGCFMLAMIAEMCVNWNLKYNVALAVTSREETDSAGADELAENVQADLVLVLDTTYESNDVRLGKGPVLTIEDDGIKLDDEFVKRIIKLFDNNLVNLQIEDTYGLTESASFVDLSRCKKIIPLLIPQRNNHSNEEQIDIKDIDAYLEVIRIICSTELSNFE